MILIRDASSQLISQELNQGVDFDYYLPRGRSREGYYWSLGSWSSCSSQCGSGKSLDRSAHLPSSHFMAAL